MVKLFNLVPSTHCQVWDLSEGRCPWGSGLAQPLIELRDIDSGVWAMAAPSCRRSSAVDGGPLSGPTCLVTGSEEGVVQTWDLRAGGRSLWAVQPEASGGDYIGGLALDPISGRFVVVASGDGEAPRLFPYFKYDVHGSKYISTITWHYHPILHDFAL